MQRLGITSMRANVNTGEEFCEVLTNQCQPNEGNPMHPSEERWGMFNQPLYCQYDYEYEP